MKRVQMKTMLRTIWKSWSSRMESLQNNTKSLMICLITTSSLGKMILRSASLLLYAVMQGRVVWKSINTKYNTIQYKSWLRAQFLCYKSIFIAFVLWRFRLVDTRTERQKIKTKTKSYTNLYYFIKHLNRHKISFFNARGLRQANIILLVKIWSRVPSCKGPIALLLKLFSVRLEM